jgi:hypothetical protein
MQPNPVYCMYRCGASVGDYAICKDLCGVK